MASERLKPIVEIESATAADILGGLEALVGRIRTRGAGQGIIVRAPGDGPDRLMNWALQEVNNAMQSTSKEEREHHCVDAVLHARRALSCLVDWYLERDLGMFQRCSAQFGTESQISDYSGDHRRADFSSIRAGHSEAERDGAPVHIADVG